MPPPHSTVPKPTMADRDGSTASSRRSPEVKAEPGSPSSDDSDAPMSKRVRASVSKERSARDDADPYGFPRDEKLVKRAPKSPFTVLKKPSGVPSKSASVTPSNAPSNTRTNEQDTEMEDAPGVNETAANTRPLATARQTATESADVVMAGTDESERPLKGVKTIPKPPSAEQVGTKKPPEDQRTETKPNTPPIKSSATPELQLPPPPPPPQTTKASTLPLRKPNKLKRLRELHKDEMLQEEEPPQKVPSMDEQARDGLRRALVLALDHVGFSSATNEALESFLCLTETYMQSLAEDVTHFAFAARRNQPLPADFDVSLARFNLRTSALRPHLRNPVAKSKLQPTYFDPLARHPGQGGDLPLLAEELSGKAEKDAKAYIPSGFPDFPSIHTYRHTPVDVDSVTVKGSGLRYDDGTAVVFSDDEGAEETQFTVASNATTLTATGGGAATAAAAALDGINGSVNGAGIIESSGSNLRSDPKRIREAAAVEAKQAEEALRGLMRASKINKLKEVRSSAERSKLNKQRFSLWELAMRELIEDAKGAGSGGGGNASQSRSLILNKAALREEIADQSMMVNADKSFHRKEIPRIAKKSKQKASG